METHRSALVVNRLPQSPDEPLRNRRLRRPHRKILTLVRGALGEESVGDPDRQVTSGPG